MIWFGTLGLPCFTYITFQQNLSNFTAFDSNIFNISTISPIGIILLVTSKKKPTKSLIQTKRNSPTKDVVMFPMYPNLSKLWSKKKSFLFFENAYDTVTT